MAKRVAIMIDGSNFYFKLKDLGLENQLKLNFSDFIKFLSNGETLVQSRYYIGAVKTDGTKKMKSLHSNQQKLFSHLKSNGVSYSLGYLLKSSGRFHEKGVDVNMAVDMLELAYEDKADRIVLITSDTDLIPAIRKVKKLGKEVEYVGFSHLPSIAMVSNSSSSRLLAKTDIKSFVS